MVVKKVRKDQEDIPAPQQVDNVSKVHVVEANGLTMMVEQEMMMIGPDYNVPVTVPVTVWWRTRHLG